MWFADKIVLNGEVIMATWFTFALFWVFGVVLPCWIMWEIFCFVVRAAVGGEK